MEERKGSYDSLRNQGRNGVNESGKARSCSLRVESREALSVWLCEMHNNGVNRLTGRDEFESILSKLDCRWYVHKDNHKVVDTAQLVAGS